MGRRALPAVGLLALLALGAVGRARSLAADEPAGTGTAVETLLSSPLASEREDGVERLVAAGSAGLETARGLCEASRLPLRLGGWRALARLGEVEDLEAALAALELLEGLEAAAAARTALALSERLPIPSQAPLPEGRLSAHAAAALLGPVSDLLWRSSPEQVPSALLHLGSGVARCLAALAGRADIDRGLRVEAVDALAAVGGATARTALVELLELDAPPETAAVYRALRHVAPGPGLEPAQAAALRCLVEESGPWRRAEVRQEAALFLQACPPHEPDQRLRAALGFDLRRADAGPRGGAAVEMLRTWLALGPPDDVELERASRMLFPATVERGWMVLALEPWKDRAPVRAALEQTALLPNAPSTVVGWARLLLSGAGDPSLPARARASIEAPVAAGGPDARRLGLLLLARLDVEPPPDLIALGLGEPDPWCRVFALNLMARLPVTHALQAEARAQARDRDSWVVEAAAELPSVPWDPTLRRRLAEILLGGPRDLRTRVVNLLQRRSEADGLEAPADQVAAASVDLRLRLAARLLAPAPAR